MRKKKTRKTQAQFKYKCSCNQSDKTAHSKDGDKNFREMSKYIHRPPFLTSCTQKNTISKMNTCKAANITAKSRPNSTFTQKITGKKRNNSIRSFNRKTCT